MSPRTKNITKRRWLTLLWGVLVVIAVFTLIFYEQIALLYILATLAVTAVMIIVALADLRRGDAPAEIPSPPATPQIGVNTIRK